MNLEPQQKHDILSSVVRGYLEYIPAVQDGSLG